MAGPLIAIGRQGSGRQGFERAGRGWVEEAVRRGGGEPVDLDDPAADGLVWMDTGQVEGLRAALEGRRRLRWVQLPFAGVEPVADAGLLDTRLVWTCAKGAYAEPVAEHALALALAGLRDLRTRSAATSWGDEGGISLFDAPVTILGGGGITESLLALLAPFRVEATVVRRRPDPVPGAARTVATAELDSVLPGAAVVFLALALTRATIGIIGAEQLALMEPTAWLVNVARGGHVDTDALVAALAAGRIGGAALDVTDPEPLPDGHPLWREPRCLVTPHTADTWAMVQPRLAARITENVARFAGGRALIGLVDPGAGY